MFTQTQPQSESQLITGLGPGPKDGATDGLQDLRCSNCEVHTAKTMSGGSNSHDCPPPGKLLGQDCVYEQLQQPAEGDARGP